MTDALDILAWRNDYYTRKMSGNVELIGESQHLEWFDKVINNPRRILLIALDTELNAKIGMVRFDLDEDLHQAEISININPIYRNNGYGKQCLFDATNYFTASYPACNAINALIRVQNEASIRAFSSVGYREVAQVNDLKHLRLDTKEN